MRRFPAALAGLALAACVATPGPGVAPGSDLATASPTAPAFPSPSAPVPLGGTFTPSPFVPPPSTTRVAIAPLQPCPGEAVAITGEGYAGVRRVEAFLAPQPRWVPDALVPPGQGVYGEVALGAADVDAGGRFRLAFDLAPRWPDARGGGALVLQPGVDYAVRLREADTDRPVGEAGIAIDGWPARCPADALEPPPALRWDPAAPCGSEPAHLRGSGFTGPIAHVRFKAGHTRFGDGPHVDREVPVAADGTFDLRFVPDEVRTAEGTPIFTARADLEAYVYDAATHRALVAPIPYCNPGLARAIAAPSIPLVGGLGGVLSRPGSPPPDPELEMAVLRSDADLQALAARHRLSGDQIARFAGTDFSRRLALMVVSGPADGASFDEIVAVERRSSGLLVHVVRWELWMPALGDLAFDFVEIPRTDEAVTFAPVAQGVWTQRRYLTPWLDARGAVKVQEAPQRP